MESHRIDLIERIVATRNDVIYGRSLYCALYYAFLETQRMTPEDAREFYPWLYDPIIDSYKLDSQSGALLTHKILESMQISMLEDVTCALEHDAYDDY